MKETINSILAMSIIVLIAIGCSKESSEIESITDPVVQKFIKSETFLGSKKSIENYGDIAYKEIKSGVINIENEQISIIGIPVYKNKRKVGIVEIVDLKTTGLLPNNYSYALNYVNLKNYNSSTSTGFIEMVDLNYDNYLHSIIEVKSNHIKSWNTKGLSNEISLKYIKLRRDPKGNLKSTQKCDENNNGNVSYSECYHCIKSAISQNGTSEFICDIPVAGWATCWASTAAACVYISARY